MSDPELGFEYYKDFPVYKTEITGIKKGGRNGQFAFADVEIMGQSYNVTIDIKDPSVWLDKEEAKNRKPILVSNIVFSEMPKCRALLGRNFRPEDEQFFKHHGRYSMDFDCVKRFIERPAKAEPQSHDLA